MRERSRQERDEIQARQELERRSLRHRRGEVTDLDPLTIEIGGVDFTEFAALDSATFAVGDIVSVLVWRGDLLVLGPTSESSVGGWISATLHAGNGYGGTAMYRKDNGVVRLSGWVSVSGFSAGTNVLQSALPAGFRPPERKRYIVIQGSNDKGRIDVATDGQVTAEDMSGSGNFSLDGITFVAG